MACLNSSDHSKLEFGPFSVLVNLLDELPWRQVAQTRVGTDTPFNPRLRSPARNAFHELPVSRLASSTPSSSRWPSQLMPMAMSTAWERITPSMRTFS